MRLSDVVAGYVFGSVFAEELPGIAADALATGSDSPSLRKLAATSRTDIDEIRSLFLAALGEMNIAIPSKEEAALSAARGIALQIDCGEIAPYEGAVRIWHDVYTRFPELIQVRPFVGLASEWEDDISHRGEYERLIREESARFLQEREST
jgi:hypothetical protein